MTLGRTIVGGLCLSFSPLLLSAISLPAMALIIRQLGAVQYGQWVMASALIASIATVTSLGLRGAFIRQLATHPNDTESALADQLGTRVLITLLASLFAIGLAVLLQYAPVVIACVAICSLGLILTSIATTLIDVLQSQQRSATVASTNLFAGLVLTSASVIVCFAGGGPIAIATTYLLGPTLAAIVAFRLVRASVPIRLSLGFPTARRVLSRCRSFTAQQLLNFAPLWVESIVLPKLIGAAQFGYFGAGTLLATRLSAIPDGLCTATYPLLSKRFSEDQRSATRLAVRSGALIALGCVAIAIVSAFASGWIAQVLFPTHADLCQAVLLITIWTLPLQAIDLSIGYAANAAGADTALARATLPASLVNMVLTLYLILTLGIVGACIAMPLRHLVRIVLFAQCALGSGRRTSDAPLDVREVAVAA